MLSGLFSHDTRHTAGVLLLTVLAIEYGGTYILRLVRGSVPATPLQLRLSRAGHAHAGVLVILALVVLPYVDAAGLTGFSGAVARSGVWLAAILMPLGFFLAVAGKDVRRPNRFIALVYLGAGCLGAGVLTTGIGLLAS
ncbi:MAG: hypothetical protein J2O49_09580 [Sciscionella sp.]|nr:hypothetical protein [Sciscionella sp.]